MALKALMLRKKIDVKKAALEELRAKEEGFQTREAELEGMIAEAETEEEQATVEAEIDKLNSEKEDHKKETENLESEIAGLEAELTAEEERAAAAVKKPEQRKEVKKMESRTKFFGMAMQERDAFFANEEVKSFVEQVRTCIKEKRALTNAGLLIPQVALGIIEDVIAQTSKLAGRVSLEKVAGTSRVVISGTAPEGVWTEACGKLNELALGFNDMEMDGYKVGGYIPVCNAILEDNDFDLMAKVLRAIGKAIAKALDKAILYGTGTKMPIGVVTRLAQTQAPSDYPATARAWADLHTSNVITGTGASGLALFKEIAAAAGVVVNDYADDEMTWVMNKKTHMKLMAESMDKNMNGAIVAGMNGQMPVVGGAIVELPFIPDNNIVFGYFDLYKLAQRAGVTMSQSEHVRFIEDQTVFKGTARYDGAPAIAEAFGVYSLTTTAPTTTATFASDTANA